MESRVVEVRKLFKQVTAHPGSMFDLPRIDLKEQVERAINETPKAELTAYLGRARYEPASRDEGRKNYRSGEFHSQLIARRQGREASLDRDIALSFFGGFSTRSIQSVSKTLLGPSVSAGKVSKVTAGPTVVIGARRSRDLSGFDEQSLIIDGVYFALRTEHQVETAPMLVVAEMLSDNHQVILAIQQGSEDQASTWRDVFVDLKRRGSRAEGVELGIMDGLPRLATVFDEESVSAQTRRCQADVARNVLAKVPKSMKADVADRVRDVFYAANRGNAQAAFERFVTDYESTTPRRSLAYGRPLRSA